MLFGQKRLINEVIVRDAFRYEYGRGNGRKDTLDSREDLKRLV